MEIRTTYIGINEIGIKGIWCGFIPSNVKVIEEKQVLYADTGKILRHKETGEKNHSVLLENGDSENNYEEIDERIYYDITQQNLPPLDSGQ